MFPVEPVFLMALLCFFVSGVGFLGMGTKKNPHKGKVQGVVSLALLVFFAWLIMSDYTRPHVRSDKKSDAETSVTVSISQEDFEKVKGILGVE